MGESPDRSNRTAGAEEQDAERTQEEVVDAPPSAEPAQPSAPTPTDVPTRTLRKEQAKPAVPEADAEGEPDADGPDAAEPAPAVDSATRVLRTLAPTAAPKAAATGDAPEPAERHADAAPAAPKAGPAAEGEDECDADAAAAAPKAAPAAEGETDADDSDAAEPAPAVDSATRVLRTLPPTAAPKAAATGDAPEPAERHADAAPAASKAGPAAEAEDERDADAAEPALEASATRVLRTLAPTAAPKAGVDDEPADAAAAEDEAADASDSEAIRAERERASAAPASAGAADTADADDSADADDEEEPEADEPEADEPEATTADDEADADDDEEPDDGGAAARAIADAETRAMAVFPPLPPSSGGAVPRPGGVVPAPGGGGSAPARGVPAGATAVAESPETTVEAMEVLAGLSARPMTPMRIALRRVRLWGTLLVLLVLVLGTVQVLRPLPSPKLTQSAATGYSFGGGKLALDWPVKGQAAVEVPGLGLMGQSGSGNPVPLASVTKMMTAYIVLHDHPLKKGETGPTITVDQQAVNDYNTGKPGGESVQKVAVGEKLTQYQALQMLMIPSANNIARLLGRWDAGTDAAFVQKMQATAGQLGMTQSTYTDPSGLDATTRSTAADQLKLAAAAMADPVFREVVGTQQFDSPLNGLTPNTNTLVGKNGVIGIKTGSSTAALGNLVWAAEQSVDGVKQLIVGVTLSQPAVGSGPGQGILDQVLANSKKLILSAEHALQEHTIAHKGDVVGYVDDGLGGKVPVVATQDVQVAGWSGLSVDVALRPLDGKGIPHSATAGTVVGELVVGSGATARTVPVALQSDLAAPGFGAKLTRTA
ncbi:D-alanyl-D-alanine carboxypeptidase (penicillin-binding protein 5/6) [Streptacidiphilus sp. MAP12-33]|uniref:D-alanyl-D-alanine carboxypeptidase n=1 Tax=Streptacidiphilus sp. MAP12-33 TaxID=3156266 RepID=UPI0035118A44